MKKQELRMLNSKVMDKKENSLNELQELINESLVLDENPEVIQVESQLLINLFNDVITQEREQAFEDSRKISNLKLIEDSHYKFKHKNFIEYNKIKILIS